MIDPAPEELAEWRREAPQAEIVAAGQARHASDALAQASARAAEGDDVILLVDSLTRLASAYGDAEAAKEFFDAGRTQGGAGRLDPSPWLPPSSAPEGAGPNRSRTQGAKRALHVSDRGRRHVPALRPQRL